MSTFWTITLWTLGIIVFFGLIRIMIKHPESFFDAILDILFLDLVFDLIGALFESGGDGIDW